MKTNSSLTSGKQEAVTESVESLSWCLEIMSMGVPVLRRGQSCWYFHYTDQATLRLLIDTLNSPPAVPVAGAPVRQGWRGFLCDCGKSWKEATRDYASPSSEICPSCGLNEQPIASWPDATLQVDRMGNLINDVASEDWKPVAGAPVEQTDLGEPDAPEPR